MPERRFVLPGRGDVSGQRIQREAGRFLGAHRPEPVHAVEQDRRHAGNGFHVVDHGRAGIQTGHRGERRSQPGLAAAALQRVQQRGLLAADVGARTGVHDQLQIETGAADVLAEISGVVGLGDRGLQPAQHRDDLAAHVDERVVCPDRVRRDDRPLHEEVRRRQHQRNVFAGTGFGLVGVDDQVVRLRARAGVALRDERPLRPGREACAAATAQARILHQCNDIVGIHAQRPLQRAVAVVAAVGVKGPRFRLVPEPAQHGCQLGHLSESVAFGSVSGVDGLGGTVADGPGAGWSFVASAAAFVSSGVACESVACGRVRCRHAQFLGHPQSGEGGAPDVATGRLANRAAPQGFWPSPGMCTAARRGSARGVRLRAARRRGRGPTTVSGCRRTPS